MQIYDDKNENVKNNRDTDNYYRTHINTKLFSMHNLYKNWQQKIKQEEEGKIYNP